jgi:hypothetical protein
MNLLTSTAISPLHPRMMTVSERRLGRFLRAPEGHDPAPADPPAADPAPADPPADPTVLGGDPDPADPPADPAASAVPDKYELTPPDGFENIDSEVLAEAEPTLKELNLTNDQAQKLMPIAGQLVKKTMDRAEQAITELAIAQRKEWAVAFENDAEIGGANKAQTVALAAKAFDHYGIKPDTGVRQFLNESGLGNHPDLIRFIAGVGRDLEEGSFEKGDAATTPKAPEAKLYGPQYQPKG